MAEKKFNKHASNFKDLTGQRFTRLVAIGVSDRESKDRATFWTCLCDCGLIAIARSVDLRRGRTKSCGCFHLDVNRAIFTIHGLRNTREYRSWAAAKSRCLNPNVREFRHYGGRGIKMCQRWIDSFIHFLADMGPRPEGMEIDRIDNDGNYEPNNCRWALRVTQVRNRRNTVRISNNGITLPLAEWSERTGIPYSVLNERRKRRSKVPIFSNYRKPVRRRT